MPTWVLIGALALCLADYSAWAQDCSKAMTQRDMETCAKKELGDADILQKGVYTRIANKTSGEVKRLLEMAEVSWAKYRDLQCRAETAKYEHGSISSFATYVCMTTIAQQRTEILKALYEEELRE